MKIFKYLFLVLLILGILSFSSCQKNSIDEKDNYKFTLDINKQQEKVIEIGKTEVNKELIYINKSSNQTIYVKYEFNNGFSNKKIIYRFFDNLEDYYSFFNKYDVFLDGNFYEINEDVLLVATIYQSIDSKSFNELYEKIDTCYTIIE